MQKNIVYLIGIIILITLCIQTYWNIKNYESNKVSVNNEVLAALDNSVDSYYTNLAKSDITSLIKMQTETETDNISITPNINITIDSLITKAKNSHSDLKKSIQFIDTDTTAKPKETTYVLEQNFSPTDSSVSGIVTLTNKVIISLSNENVNFDGLAKYVDDELKRRGLNFKYALSQTRDFKQIATHGNFKDPDLKFSAQSKSAYLPTDTRISLHYPNINLIALKQSSVGMILSFLFTLSIIASLLYLLRIIRQQKQIAASKSDFIGNISHELKTPIATSMSALEAIQHFNDSQDREKTDKYMAIAEQQLQKLSTMVEKILDTVSLDSEDLSLNKETIDLVPLLNNITEKQQINTSKEIQFITESDSLLVNVDAFHFENVINNIIENAVKYGGDTIKVMLLPVLSQPEILISDNGTPIDKHEKNRIFEKFYRISTHNIHDVKGYGIGLYYSKNIIEKHGGRLTLEDSATETIFKITVPYV